MAPPQTLNELVQQQIQEIQQQPTTTQTEIEWLQNQIQSLQQQIDKTNAMANALYKGAVWGGTEATGTGLFAFIPPLAIPAGITSISFGVIGAIALAEANSYFSQAQRLQAAQYEFMQQLVQLLQQQNQQNQQPQK